MFQPSLLALDPLGSAPGVAVPLRNARRIDLGQGAWVDVVPSWVRGADLLFEAIRADAPWQSRRRRMWDQVVDEPRLSTGTWPDPPSVVADLADELTLHYALDLGAVSANLYRDGQDSVAWHGDTLGRQVATTIVAIVSLGSPRRFLVRPKGGDRRDASNPATATCWCWGVPVSARSTTPFPRWPVPVPGSA